MEVEDVGVLVSFVVVEKQQLVTVTETAQEEKSAVSDVIH